MDDAKKCLVHGCTNCVGEGVFIGDLCSPCHRMLTTGEITPKYGRTFLHKLQYELELRRKTEDEIAAAVKYFGRD